MCYLQICNFYLAQINIFQGIMPLVFLFSFVNLRSFRLKGISLQSESVAVGPKLKIYRLFCANMECGCAIVN